MRKMRFVPYVLLIGLLLASPGSMSIGLAQEPEPQGEVDPQSGVSVAATVSSKFSYQGVLKENGSPVTGRRDMTFRLYSDDTCTTQVGSDIEKSDVPVTDGLFSVNLGVTHSDFNGRGLWLEAAVAGTKIGCQEILPVPYALSLRPGALVNGTVTAQREDATGRLGYVELLGLGDTRLVGAYGAGDWGVHGYSPEDIGVRGDSEGTSGVGVYGEAPKYGVMGHGDYGGHFMGAYGVYGRSGRQDGKGVFGVADATSGTGYGVQGRALSPDGYGGYFENTAGGAALKAAGPIESSEYSYLWIPGVQAQINTFEDGLDIQYGWSGSVALRANTTGNYWIVIPIDVPGVLYGQDVTVINAQIYYRVENADDYIRYTRWYKNTGPGTSDVLAEEDPTERNSTTPTSYTLAAAAETRVLDETAGGMAVSLGLHFDGTGSEREILVGGVRVTLAHE